MGPQPNLRRRHPLHHGIGSPSGAPRRRHRAALLAGLLALTIVAPTGPVEAARSQPSADVATSADARATRDWIVTLEPTAVAPDGVGIASRRYRLDSPTGRTAARGRAQLTERLIGRLEGRRGFRAGQRFGWAMQGFTAELTGPQAAALRSDPAVASVVPNAPASIATDSVPLGVARINGATGVAAGGDVDVDVAVIDTGVGPVGGPPDAPELRIAGGTDCRPRRAAATPTRARTRMGMAMAPTWRAPSPPAPTVWAWWRRSRCADLGGARVRLPRRGHHGLGHLWRRVGHPLARGDPRTADGGQHEPPRHG